MKSTEMNRLAAPYFSFEGSFSPGRPESPQANLLLLIDASADTCKQALSFGWNIRNLLFSEVLLKENENKGYTLF